MGVFQKAVWYLEVRIGEPLPLPELARLAGVSPWHLVRLFQATVGLSPMAYLRARRLTEAAKALATGDRNILSVALDAGYGSHEAFTRAFFACFGQLPSTVRTAGTTANLQLMEPFAMDKTMLVDVAAPEIRQRDAFRVIGLSVRCTFETNAVIPKLWTEFNRRDREVPEPVKGAAYGVCCDMQADGHFRYVAGFESRAKHVPDGLDHVDLPAGRYAVFRHVGHISGFNKTIYTIWNKALPDAGLEPAGRPDFELYDQRYHDATCDGIVEIWIPVNG